MRSGIEVAVSHDSDTSPEQIVDDYRCPSVTHPRERYRSLGIEGIWVDREGQSDYWYFLVLFVLLVKYLGGSDRRS